MVRLRGLSVFWMDAGAGWLVKARLLKKFEEEIAGLEKELKTELPKEIQRARELGDLRENAEYQAAKERQSFLHARIGMLRKRVGEIALLNLDKMPHDKVGLGSTVTLREEDGAILTYELVMPEDADAGKGLISTASPIGRALLGKTTGDEVVAPTPNGQRVFEITSLSTIHDE
jgi:transcription elongation factor GreA